MNEAIIIAHKKAAPKINRKRLNSSSGALACAFETVVVSASILLMESVCALSVLVAGKIKTKVQKSNSKTGFMI